MKMINHEHNGQKIAEGFFGLKTKLLGELLQKAVNYKIQIAFIGEFSKIESKSLKDLIYESNQGKQYFFTENLEVAVDKLK